MTSLLEVDQSDQYRYQIALLRDSWVVGDGPKSQNGLRSKKMKSVHYSYKETPVSTGIPSMKVPKRVRSEEVRSKAPY